MKMVHLSTATYDDPTLLLTSTLARYEIPEAPTYSGHAVEIYATHDRMAELVVSWPEELITVYLRGES